MAHLYIYQRFTYIRLYILKTVFSITHSQTRYAGARGQELGQRFQPGRLRRRACAVSSNLRCSQRSVVGSVVGCKVPGVAAGGQQGTSKYSQTKSIVVADQKQGGSVQHCWTQKRLRNLFWNPLSRH